MSLFDTVQSFLRGDTTSTAVEGDDEEIQIEKVTEGVNFTRKYAVEFEQTVETIDTQEDDEVEWLVEGDDGGVYGGERQRQAFESHKYDDEQNIFLGVNRKTTGKYVDVSIEPNDMFRHIVMFGVTGYGKSTMLKNIMVQLAYKGHGFTYIDPKGDDIEDLLEILPEERLDDIIWFEPAAGDEVENNIAFNYLDVPTDPDDGSQFEDDVQELVGNIKAILSSRDDLYARMERLVDAMSNAMIRINAQRDDDEPKFALAHLFFVLGNEESRKKFYELLEEEGMSEYVQEANKALTQLQDDQFEPLKGRLQPWILNSQIREIVSQQTSDIEIRDVVEEEKILLVNTSNVDNEVKEMVSTAVVSRIWSHVKTRGGMDNDEITPHFLCIDEFDKVFNEQMDIDRILSMARSLRLSLMMANQNPEQLPRSVIDQVFSNADTMLALNVGDPNQGRPIAKKLGVDADQYAKLGKFETLTQVMVDGAPTEPMKMKNYPDYPPVRNEETAMQVKQKSLERHGSPRADAGDDNLMAVLGEEEATEESIEAARLVNTVVDAIHLGTKYQSYQKGKDYEFIGEDLLKDVLAALGHDDPADVEFSQVVENYQNLIKIQSINGGKMHRYGLTEEGRSQAMQLDSGSSGSAGKHNHRQMLRETRDEFAKIGIAVRIPEQGGEMPDGVGIPFGVEEDDPAVRIINDTDSQFAIEAESTTAQSRPSQMLKNLKKAVAKDEKCVFVLRNGHDDFDFDYNANKIEEVIDREPRFASKMKSGDAKFYNKNHPLKQKDKNNDTAVALRPKLDSENRAETRWWRTSDGRIVLRDGDGNEQASFNNVSEFRNWSLDDFPAYHVKTHDGEFSVIQDGEEIHLVNSHSDLKEHWVPVKRPWIPEIEFDGAEIPDSDAFSVVILPDDEQNEDAQVYEDGEWSDLLVRSWDDLDDSESSSAHDDHEDGVDVDDPTGDNHADDEDELSENRFL